MGTLRYWESYNASAGLALLLHYARSPRQYQLTHTKRRKAFGSNIRATFWLFQCSSSFQLAVFADEIIQPLPVESLAVMHPRTLLVQTRMWTQASKSEVTDMRLVRFCLMQVWDSSSEEIVSTCLVQTLTAQVQCQGDATYSFRCSLDLYERNTRNTLMQKLSYFWTTLVFNSFLVQILSLDVQSPTHQWTHT